MKTIEVLANQKSEMQEEMIKLLLAIDEKDKKISDLKARLATANEKILLVENEQGADYAIRNSIERDIDAESSNLFISYLINEISN